MVTPPTLGERAPWAGARAASPVDAAAGIGTVTLGKQIKGFSSRPGPAARTHWLRHTHIAHALAAGAPLEVVQQNAGHASLDTTTRYVTTEAERRMEAMQAVWKLASSTDCAAQIVAPFRLPKRYTYVP